ncbi:ABC transporter ATP-binding protein [Nonomuraea sp. NPDC050783]|uniref:ABC transporter ATP-binding protein n=1 Tax=Nonomuraea sp. NPDC050783 TaxID=3154634 RepID=UPI00346723E8
MARDEILRCRGLRKTFGDLVAVDGVGFTVAAGETYGLLGPGGAGKTTTLAMIAGTLHRDGGEVLVRGRPHDPSRPWGRRRVGYVPQEPLPALSPGLTGRENLRLLARRHGLGRARARRRADEVLEAVGLTGRAGQAVKAYSDGTMRRLRLGVGLLLRPRLLILDEPTAGLDPRGRDAVLASLATLAGEGVAILCATRRVAEAGRLCDRVGLVDLGRIRAECTRAELAGPAAELDRITLTVDGRPDVPALLALPGVREATGHEGHVDVMTEDAGRALPGVLAAAAGAGMAVRAAEVYEPALESVFVRLTGGPPRG